MLLAIDTSTSVSGLACYNQQGLLGECVWNSGRNHTTQVLPQLDMLLRHLGAVPSDLRAVSVALGPGSWSGLRVGLSIAKGLALAGGLPLIGVGTLDAMAYQHRHAAAHIHPLIRLGRERFASAAFASAEEFQRRSDYLNLTLAELCAGLTEHTLFCGEIEGEVAQQIRQQAGELASFPSPAANLRRPGFLAELAWQRLAAAEHDNLATLEPIYLGEPVRKEG